MACSAAHGQTPRSLDQYYNGQVDISTTINSNCTTPQQGSRAGKHEAEHQIQAGAEPMMIQQLQGGSHAHGQLSNSEEENTHNIGNTSIMYNYQQQIDLKSLGNMDNNECNQ